MHFDHNKIDKKWQDEWHRLQAFKSEVDWNKKKFYALDMFPYPSGAGLHVGHLASYTPTDIVSRFKRAQGFNVLHPMGYDAFGLPAEQYAIQTGIHPLETTTKAIQNFKKQLQSFGFSFDWNREISSCDPSYYKWTQYIFKLLFQKKLAYKKQVPVNWCPALRTTLANEEVVDGKSERGDHPVFQKNIEQWLLKITDYAEDLLQNLEELDWPTRTKDGQRNWIGKSEGTTIQFQIKDSDTSFSTFTTRPDTIFGCTFIVFSPEHPLIEKEFKNQPEFKKIKEYINQSRKKSDVEKKKNLASTGVFSGAYAIHPITQKPLPILIADYVIMDYGTGVIMAVPAHDERDFIFAQNFNLNIQQVIEGEPLPFIEDGKHINSDFINGLNQKQAVQKINKYIKDHKLGSTQIRYRLRDWIFSRQRYWGEPFPIVHFPSGMKAVDEKELPVFLPSTMDYQPSEKGEPPLARIQNFVKYTDPKTKEKGQRETDTMPGSAASSWYFLRYTDPQNSKMPFGFEEQKYWMPVDLYIGGSEHTVGHLLYSRFWNIFLYRCGLVSYKEPFKKLIHQGFILGSDGQRMSKSRGNTVNPDQIREKYGADTLRLYISFLGPIDKNKPWSDTGIEGCRRFLERLWRLCIDENLKPLTDTNPMTDSLQKLMHKTILKVTKDIEQLHLNTAISSLMILLNEAISQKCRNHDFVKIFCKLLQPLAPHISEEIWHLIGEKNLVSLAPWPVYDSALIQEETTTIAVQLNGKSKDTIELSIEASEEEALKAAKRLKKVSSQVEGKNIFKVIYKKGKILNILFK